MFPVQRDRPTHTYTYTHIHDERPTQGVEALKDDGKGIQGPHVTKILKQGTLDVCVHVCLVCYALDGVHRSLTRLPPHTTPNSAVEDNILTKCDNQRYKVTLEQRKVCVCARLGL